MENKFYSRVAAVIMAVIGQIISIPTLAQQMVPVTELQTRDDGTQVQVEKMVKVPEKSAEEVAAAKRKAATVTAEEDDLQYFLNNLAKTRAGESTVVIDLSTFSATTRETTLEVSNGLSLKFTNGTLKRGTGLAEGSPIIRISNGTEVEFDETVTISGENLSTNGSAVVLEDASLKTAAWIGNTQFGTQNRFGMDIWATSEQSKLNIYGSGGSYLDVSYNGNNEVSLSSCNLYLFHHTNANVVFDGASVTFFCIPYLDAGLYTKSSIKRFKLFNSENFLYDGITLLSGTDDYKLTSGDVDNMELDFDSYLDQNDYEKCLEGNSIVLRKKVKDLQSDINNAADNTETTINLDNYGELTTGILIPTGKKIKMTGTKNITLASNFTGDYIFRTEGDAQLDITIPGFSGYSSTSLPKYGFVAGYAESKIQVNQLGTNTLSIPNTLLAVEKGGTIDCYANISTKGVYIAAGGTMNIYSENGEVETSTTDEGGTVNITGQVKFNETFTSLGTATLLSENVTSLAKLVLGKQSSMTFTSKWVKPTSLNISFKDNDYVLDQTYITFESSTTMLSGFETVRFTLQSDEHSAYLDNDTHQLSIEEVDGAALAHLDAEYQLLACELDVCAEQTHEIEVRLESYYKQGLLTEEELRIYVIELTKISAGIKAVDQYLSIYMNLRSVFYGKKSVDECYVFVNDLANRCYTINIEIEKLEYDVENLVSSHKKTFTNTDDLQDYLNSLAGNNATTPEDPAKVSVADGTEIDDIVIPEGTHVEIDVDGNGGESGDDLQAYLNGLVTVNEGASLTLRGNYTLRGTRTTTFAVHGTIDIYATIILEGTKTEVVHIYNGGTVNWRGNMTSGKIVNEGTLNLYSGTTDYVENRGTAQHYAGICHHIVNHETYYLKGGSINTTGTEYGYAFENYGTAHLTGGTIVSSKTLIINYVNSKTYIDGVKLDDSNATSTIISYSDFHIRGDYSPKHIVLDNGVRINFITVWTVRWHITFIDNRTTIRKVIFHSDEFDVNDDFIQFIDFDFPDGYRWYYNATEKGIELRDTKVYDSDDLQAFLDRLAKSSGSASDPVILDGDNHTVDVTMDANGLFEFPGNSNVEVRNIIFRFVSTTSHKTWYIPSGSTVILNNATLDGGEDEYGNDNAEMMVDGGQLFVNNVVFINLHLNINCTIYICSPLSSRIYLVYDNNGEIVDGTHVAEGRMGYVLTEADLDKFGYYDYYGSGKLWKFVLAGNAIELYQEISGINTLSENNHPRVYVDGVGKLNITGVSLDAQCFIYSSEGALVKAGTVAEVTASGGMLARGCYVLKVGTTTVKFVR